MEKLAITIFPNTSKRKELLSACRMIASQTTAEVGCMDCRVFADSDTDSSFRIEQHWQHWGPMETYFRSDHFTALLGAMKLLAINWEMAINNGAPESASAAIQKARSP